MKLNGLLNFRPVSSQMLKHLRHPERKITIDSAKGMYEQMPDQVHIGLPIHKGSIELSKLSGQEGKRWVLQGVEKPTGRIFG